MVSAPTRAPVAATKASSQPGARPTLLQRKCACGEKPGLTGECEECGKKRMLGLQRKTVMDTPGDRCDREVDRVADVVTNFQAGGRPPEPVSLPAITPVNAGAMQRSASPAAGAEPVRRETPVSGRSLFHSAGEPLAPEVRTFHERLFGHDFADVRVHTDTAAAQSARGFRASAFTMGTHIAFGRGLYQPKTPAGKRLLAHELAHVVQQRGAVGSGARVDPSSELEAEARRAARAADQHGGLVRITGAMAPGIACNGDDPELMLAVPKTPQATQQLLHMQQQMVKTMMEFHQANPKGFWQFAILEFTKGSTRLTTKGFYNGKLHAEEDALLKLEKLLPRDQWRSGTIRMVVSAENCPGCQTVLSQLAQLGVTVITYMPAYPTRDEKGKLSTPASAKAALRQALKAGKLENMTLVSDRIFPAKEPGAKTPGTGGGPAPGKVAAVSTPPKLGGGQVAAPEKQKTPAPAATLKKPRRAKPAGGKKTEPLAPQRAPGGGARPQQKPSGLSRRGKVGVGAAAGAEAVRALNHILGSIGDELQRRKANTAYFEEAKKARKVLRDNPGYGAFVFLDFQEITPPAQSEEAATTSRFLGATWRMTKDPSNPRSLYTPEYGKRIRTEHIWIPPVNQTGEEEAEAEAVVAVTTAEEFVKYTFHVEPSLHAELSTMPTNYQDFVWSEYYIKVYRALLNSKKTTAGQLVDLQEVSIAMPTTLYESLRKAYTGILSKSLSARLAKLRTKVRRAQTRLDKFLQEGAVARWWKGRKVEVDAKLLWEVHAHTSSAEESIKAGRLSMAYESISAGEDEYSGAEKQLFLYEHGFNLPE